MTKEEYDKYRAQQTAEPVKKTDKKATATTK